MNHYRLSLDRKLRKALSFIVGCTSRDEGGAIQESILIYRSIIDSVRSKQLNHDTIKVAVLDENDSPVEVICFPNPVKD